MDGIHILLEEWNGILSRLSWKTTAVIAVRCPREVRVVVTQESSTVGAYRTSTGPQLYSKALFSEKEI